MASSASVPGCRLNRADQRRCFQTVPFFKILSELCGNENRNAKSPNLLDQAADKGRRRGFTQAGIHAGEQPAPRTGPANTPQYAD
jgi:hypothetical protein